MYSHWTEEKPRKAKNGERWHFTYWYSVWTSDRTNNAQRLFFWNEDRTERGVVVLIPGATIHYSRIRSLIDKLVADSKLREKHYRDIEFPLERHYADYGALPEELQIDSLP